MNSNSLRRAYFSIFLVHVFSISECMICGSLPMINDDDLIRTHRNRKYTRDNLSDEYCVHEMDGPSLKLRGFSYGSTRVVLGGETTAQAPCDSYCCCLDGQMIVYLLYNSIIPALLEITM